MIVCSCNVLSDHDDPRRCRATMWHGLCGEVYGCLGCCARTICRIMNEASGAADAACCPADS
jgi:bacterioferritin-associated ferredoxin